MKIAHLADLHLGFRAYNRISAKGINQREADVFRAFTEALEKIKELNVHILLMAGDIFHVPHPHNLAIIRALKILAKFLKDTDIEVVMIAGNHESVRSSDNQCILEIFSFLPRTHIASHQIALKTLNHLSTLVTCIPHNALLNLDEFVIQPDPLYKYNILMLHGTVDSDRVNDYGGHDVPRQLLEKGWNYTACGHFHSFTDLGNHAFYAGAIERTSNNIWQEADQQKGFIEFDLDTKIAIFHPLSTPRPTIDLPQIDAKGLTPQQINQQIKNNADTVDITDKLVRQKIMNMPKSFHSQLDNKHIRQLQNRATHYLLDLRPPEYSTEHPSEHLGQQTITTPSVSSLATMAQSYLQKYPLPASVQRNDFVERGCQYLQPR